MSKKLICVLKQTVMVVGVVKPLESTFVERERDGG